MRQLLALVLKGTVSASLLYFALKGVNWTVIAERLNRVDAAWLAAIIVAANLQVFLAALRWREIADQCGARISLATASRYTFIAAFFNQTLLSTVGGDAARVWLLARQAGWKNATYSVLLDRVIGLAALAVLVLACLPWSLELVRNPVGRWALLAIGIGSICGFIVFLALGIFRRPWLDRWWPALHLASAAAITLQLLGSKRRGPLVVALSTVVQLLTVVVAWGAARALALPLDPLQALLLIPPVILVAAIPISIAGWGVRESAMMTAFTYAGLAETDGLLVSVLFGAVMFVTGAEGGLVWILNRAARPPPAKPEE
jgi:uncharacterized membrane protein YbhN (UPF0104 family)